MKRAFSKINIEISKCIPSKMARIQEIEASNQVQLTNYDNQKVVKEFSEKDTKVVFKDYVLNDVKALEKKWSMRNVEPIKVSKEAIDGSNIHVDMKTSLFEVVKNNLVAALEVDDDIEKIVANRTTKVKATNNVSADVEYIIDIMMNLSYIYIDPVLGSLLKLSH